MNQNRNGQRYLKTKTWFFSNIMAINVRVSSCSTIFFFRALPKRLYDFKTLWLVYWLVGALWRDTKTVIGLTIVQDAVLVHFVLEQRTQQRTLYTAKNTYQHNVLLSTRSISTLGSVPWHLVKTEGFFLFFSYQWKLLWMVRLVRVQQIM